MTDKEVVLDKEKLEKRRSAGRERERGAVSSQTQISMSVSAPVLSASVSVMPSISSSASPSASISTPNVPMNSVSSSNTSSNTVQDDRKSPRQRKAEISATSNASFTSRSSAVTNSSATVASSSSGSGAAQLSSSHNMSSIANTNASSANTPVSSATGSSSSAQPMKAQMKGGVAHAGDSSIAKPTNARHVVHVERDATTGALVLVRGDEVVTLTGDEALASYSALLAHHVATSEQQISFPPRYSTNPIVVDRARSRAVKVDDEAESSDSDSSDDAPKARSSTPPLKGKERARSPDVRSKASALDPLRAPRSDDKDERFKVTPELTRFSSPYHHVPMVPTARHMTLTAEQTRLALELSESEGTASVESTVEEERRTLIAAKRARREKLIGEFVRTEGIHVEALKSVIVDYVAPLREAKVLTSQQQKNLFSNIELMLMWNMDFLQALKDRLKVGGKESTLQEDTFSDNDEADVDNSPGIGEVCFGDIVVKSSVILRQLFAQYNQNYALAQLTYQELMKKQKEFEQFVNARAGSNLLTALYLPIQRMIMYDSLLKEILILTPATHADFENLSAAYKLLRSMDRAATRVAEKRKNLDAVLRIQNSLLGSWDIAQPHRAFVFEEALLLVVGKALKERTLFLFNDLLLLVKEKKKNKFEVERSVALDKVTVDSYDHDRHLFKVSVVSEGEAMWFHSENKLSWVQLLRSTQARLHAPPDAINDLLAEEHDYERDVRSNLYERDVLRAGLGSVPLTKKLLKAKIVKWALMEDSEAMAREVRRLARRIAALEQLRASHGVQLDDDDSDDYEERTRESHHRNQHPHHQHDHFFSQASVTGVSSQKY